jgi:hypothetical protein
MATRDPKDRWCRCQESIDMNFKIFFGHPNSVGVAVEASSEKEARITAMNLLRNNRGGGRWDARHFVNWEDRIGNLIYRLNPSEPQEFAGFSVVKETGEVVYAGPPFVKDFGAFPPIMKVELIE